MAGAAAGDTEGPGGVKGHGDASEGTEDGSPAVEPDEPPENTEEEDDDVQDRMMGGGEKQMREEEDRDDGTGLDDMQEEGGAVEHQCAFKQWMDEGVKST